METIEIRGDMIRLGQLMKLAGVVGVGSDVKALLASVPITVNGEPESRRGRQLHDGDIVDIDGQQLKVAAPQP
jgi:ribosome-associated protein